MGNLTRQQVVQRGLRAAACPSTLEVRMNELLNAWLSSQYAAMDWPFLTRQKVGVSFVTGATAVAFGAGNAGVTQRVKRVIDPIRLYNSDYTVRAKMRVSSVHDVSIADDPTINDPAKHKGIPERCFVRPHETTQGAFNIIPSVFPDRDLLAVVDYVVIPDDIDETSAGNATKPVYPNDRTLIQAVKHLALDFDRRGGEAAAALEILGGMVGDDKLKFGALPGINQQWGLDPNVHR